MSLCNSDAIYHYGWTRHEKRRYLCLVCGRQFSTRRHGKPEEDRPCCPSCGSSMHVYKRDPSHVCYRCSRYPTCRTYVQRTKEKNQ